MPERLHAIGLTGGKERNDSNASATVAELTDGRRDPAPDFCRGSTVMGAEAEYRALLTLQQETQEQALKSLLADGLLAGKGRRDGSTGATFAELTVCRGDQGAPFCPGSSSERADAENS